MQETSFLIHPKFRELRPVEFWKELNNDHGREILLQMIVGSKSLVLDFDEQKYEWLEELKLVKIDFPGASHPFKKVAFYFQITAPENTVESMIRSLGSLTKEAKMANDYKVIFKRLEHELMLNLGNCPKLLQPIYCIGYA